MDNSIYKKKLALILFGISLGKLKHWKGETYLIDYRKSFDNYQNTIFKYFQNLNYEIDVFFCSNKIYNKIEKKQLVSTYKPLKYSFLPNDNNKTISRNKKIAEAVKNCLDSNIKYDHCLITRFDLLFNKSFDEAKINFHKLNLISRLENENVICDNFYFMPFSFLHNFYSIIQKINIYSHFLEKEFNQKFSDINFIYNENKHVIHLSFYKIVRTPI